MSSSPVRLLLTGRKSAPSVSAACRAFGADQHPSRARAGARAGEAEGAGRLRDSDRSRAGVQHPTSNADRRHRDGLRRKTGGRERHPHKSKDRRSPNRHAPVTPTPLEIAIRFLPYSPAFENVAAQIKSGSVAYSLFALARLFLEKPVGYEVCLTAKQESPLYRLGDNGVVSADREFLEPHRET